MRCVLQRVSRAAVKVNGRILGEIQNGLLLFAGCERDDTDEDFRWISRKVAELRVFPGDGESGFDRSLADVDGAVLVISQFTLLADVKKGRRPSFTDAMPVEEARGAFERFLDIFRATGLRVETGEFQATMDVESVNHGPVTLLLDSRK